LLVIKNLSTDVLWFISESDIIETNDDICSRHRIVVFFRTKEINFSILLSNVICLINKLFANQVDFLLCDDTYCR
jgi:hypothetical protein